MANEKRLIDADKLLECMSLLEATGGHWLYRKACDDMIQGLFPELVKEQHTVDAVEVVRCKDCIHYDAHYQCCDLHSSQPNIYDSGCDVGMKPNDFCSYGGRRTE